MPDFRFVAAAVFICSWACAGGDAPGPSDSDGAQRLARPELPGSTSSATAQLADDPREEVVSGGENPTTEGSNTNWMPTEPWLEGLHRPQARERPDLRKPVAGQQGNASSPDPATPSPLPRRQGESSSSDSSSSGPSSNDSTPSPD